MTDPAVKPPPSALPPDIPDTEALQFLASKPRWVNWMWVKKDKWTKPPYQPNGELARSTDPSTWSTYSKVLAAAKSGRFDGIGYVLFRGAPGVDPEEWPADTLVGVDFDHVIDEQHNIDETVMRYVMDLNTYVEVSPSGTGLRCFLHGDLPPGGRKKGPIELYENGRYLTITGQHLKGEPTTIGPRQEEVEAFHGLIFAKVDPPSLPPRQVEAPPLIDTDLIAKASKADDAFSDLYAGRWQGSFDSQSNADLALCGKLAFWTAGNSAQIDRLFRASGLMREKWDTRRGSGTYGSQTVDKALSDAHEFYSPGGKAPQNVVPIHGAVQVEEDARPRRLPARSSASEAALPAPPIDWTVDGIAAPGSLVLCAGPPGAGKTYLLHDMATHVALGLDWCGRAVNGPRRVLFLDEESGKRRFLMRTGQSVRAHPPLSWDLPIEFFSLAGWNLTQPGSYELGADGTGTLGTDMLQAVIAECKPDLVIIDALADIALGADENAVKEMQPIFHKLRQIADAEQCAIILIHHANKMGGYRGSTAIAGAVDLMLMIENVVGSTTRMKVSSAKERDTEKFFFEVERRFDVTTDTFDLTLVDPSATVATPMGGARRHVMEYLEFNGPTLLTDLAATGGDTHSSESIRQAVKHLTGAGQIERTEAGSQTKNATYRLVR